ncbi:unknown [Gryllus bimaculatus nudivirus]|uniref:Uncharacterized protein n=1 Tax=Gryllus bimaculatus nudivirus TaxID=432587 RepID=A4L228_9VIRU|nr:hypothetical protein GrBNV_gp65 [Gryllus bimaculatus nudivirus]ABO45398.1 unknown [Gryllus bimaculatus nudivirus]
MTILHGKVIAKRFKNGLYHKNCKRYIINIDGDIIAHKGLVEDNLTRSNPSLSVAEGSFRYLQNIVKKINDYFKLKEIEIKVYMDSSVRVLNKQFKPPVEYEADIKYVKFYFSQLCNEYYNLIYLQSGEAELQMYHMRDKSIELNVFVTADSDMFSICYNHECVKPNDVRILKSNNTDSPVDLNYYYDITCADIIIKDSCLWVRNNSNNLIFYGFDKYGENKLSTKTFHVLCAVSGTDFTKSLITETGCEAILNNKNDISYINSLENDEISLLYVFLYLICKNNKYLKPKPKNYKQKTEKELKCHLLNYLKTIQVYVDYIESGNMTTEDVTSLFVDTYSIQNYLLSIMKSNDTDFTKKTMFNWCSNISLQECILRTKQQNIVRKGKFISKSFKTSKIVNEYRIMSMKPKKLILNVNDSDSDLTDLENDLIDLKYKKSSHTPIFYSCYSSSSSSEEERNKEAETMDDEETPPPSPSLLSYK